MKVAAAPRAVREIAWKAQMRLCGKQPNVIATAIARELSAFIWAINREVMAQVDRRKVIRDCRPLES
jgi:hypothetical protein